MEKDRSDLARRAAVRANLVRTYMQNQGLEATEDGAKAESPDAMVPKSGKRESHETGSDDMSPSAREAESREEELQASFFIPLPKTDQRHFCPALQ